MTLPTLATIIFAPSLTWTKMTHRDLETFAGIEGTGYIAETANWTFVADHTPNTITIQAFPTTPNQDDDHLTWVLDNNGD